MVSGECFAAWRAGGGWRCGAWLTWSPSLQALKRFEVVQPTGQGSVRAERRADLDRLGSSRRPISPTGGKQRQHERCGERRAAPGAHGYPAQHRGLVAIPVFAGRPLAPLQPGPLELRRDRTQGRRRRLASHYRRTRRRRHQQHRPAGCAPVHDAERAWPGIEPAHYHPIATTVVSPLLETRPRRAARRPSRSSEPGLRGPRRGRTRARPLAQRAPPSPGGSAWPQLRRSAALGQ